MTQWLLSDIAWADFDPSKVRPELVAVAKAACMVEHNSHDYARYLCDVFEGDAEFQQAARDWALEEVQHGQALRKWAELADPTFDFDESFRIFTTGYQLPANVKESVRGSRCGELVARCIVEIGTSSYYTAIKEYTDEPVLQTICGHIAADEFRHYKLFYTHLKRYLKQDGIGTFERLKIALGRIAESEDDELAYAFFAAQTARNGGPLLAYDRKLYGNLYLKCVCTFYRKWHIARMVSMVLKVVGLKPQNVWLNRAGTNLAWGLMRWRAFTLRSAPAV